MAIKEDTIKRSLSEDESLRELSKYLSKDFRDWLVHYPSSNFDKDSFKRTVKELRSWKAKDANSEELFRAMIILCLGWYVLNEIEDRFEEKFLDKLSSVLSTK